MSWRTWENLTTRDLAGLPPTTVAVLPVAAVEQHGPHLPLGTDAYLTDAVLDAAHAKMPSRADVLRLPTQRIGLSPEHLSFPGTLSLAPETVLASWSAIGAGVSRAGIDKLLILNGHGGQTGLVDVVATGLRRSHGMSVVRATTFRLIDNTDDRRALAALGLTETELRFGLHGGMLETSMMLAVAPELVRTDAISRFRSSAETLEPGFQALEVEGATGLGWLAEDLNAEGATGDASAATAELGHEILERMATALISVIDDLAGLRAFSNAGEDA